MRAILEVEGSAREEIARQTGSELGQKPGDSDQRESRVDMLKVDEKVSFC